MPVMLSFSKKYSLEYPCSCHVCGSHAPKAPLPQPVKSVLDLVLYYDETGWDKDKTNEQESSYWKMLQGSVCMLLLSRWRRITPAESRDSFRDAVQDASIWDMGLTQDLVL